MLHMVTFTINIPQILAYVCRYVCMYVCMYVNHTWILWVIVPYMDPMGNSSELRGFLYFHRRTELNSEARVIVDHPHGPSFYWILGVY